MSPENSARPVLPEKCHQKTLHGQSSQRSVTREICTARTRSGPDRRGRQRRAPPTHPLTESVSLSPGRRLNPQHTHTHTHHTRTCRLSPAAPVRPQALGSRGLYFCLMTLSAASKQRCSDRVPRAQLGVQQGVTYRMFGTGDCIYNPPNGAT